MSGAFRKSRALAGLPLRCRSGDQQGDCFDVLWGRTPGTNLEQSDCQHTPHPVTRCFQHYHAALGAGTGTSCSFLMKNIIIHLVKKASIGLPLPRELGRGCWSVRSFSAVYIALKCGKGSKERKFLLGETCRLCLLNWSYSKNTSGSS